MKIEVDLTATAGVTQSRWDEMKPREKKAYLAQHPNSKYHNQVPTKPVKKAPVKAPVKKVAVKKAPVKAPVKKVAVKKPAPKATSDKYPKEGMTAQKSKKFFKDAFSKAGIELPEPIPLKKEGIKLNRGRSGHSYYLDDKKSAKDMLKVLKELGGNARKVKPTGYSLPKSDDDTDIIFGENSDLQVNLHTCKYSGEPVMTVYGRSK